MHLAGEVDRAPGGATPFWGCVVAGAGWDVLGIGAVAVDDLFYLDRFPQPDEKLPVAALRRQGGGLTATAVVAAARLGARAAFCAVLGDDDLSRFSLDELRREGVDCSPVLRQPDARPRYSAILVDRSTGRRTVLSVKEGWTPAPPAHIAAVLRMGCRVLLVDHVTAAEVRGAVRRARSRGIPVVADIERPDAPGVTELLPWVDHLIVGERAARLLTGGADPAAAARELGRGRDCAAVTAGEGGCWFYARALARDVQYQPAFRVPTVDTTGCGDVFHGAYAAALARGETIAGALCIAAAAAALKATQEGGRAGIPDAARLAAFLAE